MSSSNFCQGLSACLPILVAWSPVCVAYNSEQALYGGRKGQRKEEGRHGVVHSILHYKYAETCMAFHCVTGDDDISEGGDIALPKQSKPTQIDAAPPKSGAPKSGAINNATTRRHIPGQSVRPQKEARELPASDAPAGSQAQFDGERGRDDRGKLKIVSHKNIEGTEQDGAVLEQAHIRAILTFIAVTLLYNRPLLNRHWLWTRTWWRSRPRRAWFWSRWSPWCWSRWTR